jgi:geranylgeranyl diphosphate synthase type II
LEVYKTELKKIESKISELFVDKEPRSLYDPCAYSIQSGGKRLRPFLVLISAKAVGGNFEDVYNAAVAVEILHNFTLVHDDIMDNADKRRGFPTTHVKYDLSTAILAGDNLIAIAYKQLLKDVKGDVPRLVNTFTDGIIEVCEGQSYDKEFETQDEVTVDEYRCMISKKTAALAETCCSIGAQIGGGRDEDIEALSNYGKNLGIAFQFQDDLLDIIGDENEFGKSVGGDLVEGKKTFLFLKALEKADGKVKEDLMRVVKNKGISRDEVPYYKKIYEDLGVIEESKKEIKAYNNQALEAIEDIKDKHAKKVMEELAHYLVDRSK